MYRSAFFNFIAYMLYQISKSRSLNILFSDDCDNATLNLFLKLLDAFPIPKLAEVKVNYSSVYSYVIPILYYINIYVRLTTIPGIVVFMQLEGLVTYLSFHSL